MPASELPNPNLALSTQHSALSTYLLPLGIFFTLTVLFTWPLLLNFSDHVISAGGSGDIWAHLWNIWWMKQSLTALHTSPFYTDYIFYPDGVSLRFHALNQLGGLISIPLQALFGLIPAFNILVLFNLTMAGFGAYLLARYVLTLISPDLEPPLLPCIAAGIAFAYSAGEASFVRLGQLELMSIEWLPFGVLFLLRAVLEVESYKLKVETGSSAGEGNSTPSPTTGEGNSTPSPATGEGNSTPSPTTGEGNSTPSPTAGEGWGGVRPLWRQWRSSPTFHALAAGFFIVLASQHTWYYGLYLLIFAALIGLYALIVRWRQGWRVRLLLVRQLAIAIGGFALAVSWALLPMIQELRSEPQLASPLGTIVYNAIDLPALFRPGPSLLWGKPTIIDASWYIGAVAGLLALAGLVVASRQRRSRSLAIFLALSALFFFVLALGPYLKLQPGGEEVLVHLGGTNGPRLPLPFLLLDKLPVIGGIARIASRYSIMGMLCVALLAAIGLNYLTQRRAPQGWQKMLLTALPTLLVALMMIEAIPAGGQPMLQPATPAFFSRLANDPPGSYAIMEVPNDRPALYMYYQTTHQQKLLGGYVSRHYDYPFQLETPAVRQLYFTGKLEQQDDIIDRNLAATGMAVLHYYNIRYLVIHENMFSPGERAQLQQVIDQIWPNAQPERDGDLSVYTVTSPPTSTQPALELGSFGWNLLERSAKEGSWRWTAGDATLAIWSPQPLTATLTTTVYSYAMPRHLDVSLNGSRIATQEVGVAQIPLTLTLSLQSGMNLIAFHPHEGAAPDPSGSNRMLAIGFKKITLTSEGIK
jgi:hypothetical protein